MRWYDKHNKLGKYLDGLKDMNSSKRDKIVKDILAIINSENPKLLSDENTIDFPLNINRRRWYDEDPYLWLLINGLSRGDNKTLKKVTEYFDKEAK